jgi:hypothetical protein
LNLVSVATSFFERHDSVLAPIIATMGSDQQTLNSATLQDAAKQHLIRLGLIRPRFKSPRKGEIPEFDGNTRMLKASNPWLTPLRRLLLRNIGLAGPEDI